MPSTKNVRVGAPEQNVTGAIKRAPVGTTLPTLSSISSSGVTLDAAFKGNFYVSEEGLTLAPSKSVTDIKDRSGSVVRKVLESFDGTLSWTMIETNGDSLGVAFGDQNVTTEEATAGHGNQVAVAIGADLPEEESFVFLMKDGDARMVIVVPKGQVTENGETSFVSNGAVSWPVTLSCYPDESGKSIYVYTDDGEVESA